MHIKAHQPPWGTLRRVEEKKASSMMPKKTRKQIARAVCSCQTMIMTSVTSPLVVSMSIVTATPTLQSTESFADHSVGPPQLANA